MAGRELKGRQATAMSDDKPHDTAAAAQTPLAAPDLDGAARWFNVDRPLSLTALRGKVVLLDFWTYGCINCQHTLRDLKVLEQRFPDVLVVVGVHAPKFANERDPENLRRALVRLEVAHPVAHDAEHHIARRYGVQVWPTRVIIDPAGNLVGTAVGEGNLEGFVQAIRTVVRVFDEQGILSRAPLVLDLERRRLADRPLLFPGKVLADAASNRLFVADSNHNRLVVSTLDGHLVETIGSGLQGDADGIFTQTRFFRPQGMALDDDLLYVADTENHQVRVVDFAARMVQTLAGTGQQGPPIGRGGDAMRVDLNSPWDLALKKGILIVAMAGAHQIWVIDLLHDQAFPYAGTGREACIDGSVTEAAFAQPSGLAVAGARLFVADAEGSAIRAVTLPPDNEVSTLCGADVFAFGDVDGHGARVRVQHPLGLAASGDRLFVADTYNHKIKAFDLATGLMTTLAGTGRAGHRDGPAASAEFHEPGGLSVAGRTLYVADTNNHVVRTLDLETGMVGTLELRGLTPPAAWSYLRTP